MLDHLQEMPTEIEKQYEAMDCVIETIDLDAYVPSQPRYVTDRVELMTGRR